MSTGATSLPAKVRFKMPTYPPDQHAGENVHDPNLWFWKMFPESAQRFGPGFLCAAYEDCDGLTRFVPAEINQDAWAHALSGDKRLGHLVVYYLPEKTFWFFDPRFDCFFLASEEKLKALLSHYLIRCSQELGWLAEIRPLVINFRKKDVLQEVIDRAKALLAADESFFRGEKGHRRMIAGKIIEPTSQPCYQLFVEKTLVRKPNNPLTVADAYHGYYQFCIANGYQPLARADFRSLMAETVRQKFSVGIRRDVRDKDGRQQDGWYHIDCDLGDLTGVGQN